MLPKISPKINDSLTIDRFFILNLKISSIFLLGAPFSLPLRSDPHHCQVISLFHLYFPSAINTFTIINPSIHPTNPQIHPTHYPSIHLSIRPSAHNGFLLLIVTCSTCDAHLNKRTAQLARVFQS